MSIRFKKRGFFVVKSLLIFTILAAMGLLVFSASRKVEAKPAPVMTIAGAGLGCSDSFTAPLGPNNKTFTLTYVAGSYSAGSGTTNICYDLSSSDGSAVSHFVIGLCDEQQIVGATYDNDPNDENPPIAIFGETGLDPTTQLYGFKIETGNPGRYCFVYKGEFELGCNNVALKNGQNFQIGSIVGVSCDPFVPPQGCISGIKWYDADGDGVLDPEESGIEGWAIEVTIDADGPNGPDDPITGTVLTGPGGVWQVCGLEAGATYVVDEVQPNEPNWIQTFGHGGYSGTSDGTDVESLNFGNVCTVQGTGGHTIGFWGNKNGQGMITAGDLAALVALNLRNANGSHFDPATKAAYKTWLGSANAVNMAYMLSAQLSATKLNTLHGQDPNQLIYVEGSCLGDFVTIDAVMTAADASLGLFGSTLSGHPERAYQECLKNILDGLNNNSVPFVSDTPCPFTFPE